VSCRVPARVPDKGDFIQTIRWLGLVVIVVALTVACSDRQSTVRHNGIVASERGVFVFDGYEPLRSQPVRVWYDAPADPSTAQILIVMHGVGRNSEEYLADWSELVKDHNVLVLAPEFSDEQFPGFATYNLGNVQDEDGQAVPMAEWSFQIVEALFDHVKRAVHNRHESYALFGHSAGAQFVHRFIEFMPTHRARIAVAANAGWYTVLDDSVKFPYGLDGAPRDESEMQSAFASELVIVLGGDDVDGDDDSLRHDPGSDRQGKNRLDRGLNFYRTARDAASRQSLPFEWRLIALPEVAHSHTDIAHAVAPILLDGG
jgi:poly(3-hydroxybutyrate) depolymerase